jgi:ribosomal protein S27E
MSVDKRKTRRPKTVVPTETSYDLETVLGGRGGGFGEDELGNTMKQVQKMQTDKLRSTMIKKTQVEMEKEIKDMEKSMDQGGGGGIPAMITAEEVQFLSQLPEEQRVTAIQAMAAFKSQSGGGNQTGSLGPLLIMSLLQKQPQAGVTELVTALRGLNEIVQTGKPPQSNLDSVVSIARLLLEFKDKDQGNVVDVYKRLLDEHNVDPLQQADMVLSLANKLGMQPSGGVNSEVERLKVQSQESMQQRQHEHELLIKKMERDDTRMETIMNTLVDVFKPFAAKAGDILPAMLGGGLGAAMAPRVVASQQGGPLSVKCPCGYEPIWVSEETPVAICPNCGQQVTHPAFKDKTGAQPPGGAPPFSLGSNAPPPPG